jgi:hypothetical protein
VKKFTLKKNEPIFLVRTKIFELPEVIGFLSENHLKSSMMKGDFNFTTRPFPVELDFSHLTTRELLNKTTKVKRGGWILKQSDVVTSTENEFIDIEI